jgi:hypothetical protein
LGSQGHEDLAAFHPAEYLQIADLLELGVFVVSYGSIRSPGYGLGRYRWLIAGLRGWVRRPRSGSVIGGTACQEDSQEHNYRKKRSKSEVNPFSKHKTPFLSSDNIRLFC